ncbi:uncharacterized protein (DUF302 family) [Inmirania thermothiophila]|uniref:Uncharacterized protein (DUF302 family) n=2 Tax=Inmirania thermothiophila TaxID=1750597 RepID=A0A3N1XS67_9GAMM|nr:uncharacterized protein (DUF302 family) [Inmirania thermothiophila]
MASYGFSVTVKGDVEAVRERVIEALKAEGFGVLTEIDVQRTLKEKLGEDMRPYRILGACNPPLAHRALTAEPGVGLLLPCNVVVREVADGEVEVAFMDPESVLGVVGNPALAPLGAEVKTRLERVRDAVAG